MMSDLPIEIKHMISFICFVTFSIFAFPVKENGCTDLLSMQFELRLLRSLLRFNGS